MCGVAAAYAYAGGSPAVDQDELCAVRDHMAARGPDGAGEWYSSDGRVGLAHRRLAIIDLSERGAQPMASGDGRLVVTFNGEIYNHRELRTQLERTGRVFRGDSDTEVLLQLYEEHGTAMLTMLRGMFAFALWDGRRRELLIARDAFGIKPLYYADDGRTLRTASQVKALLRAKVDTSPEPAGHAGFFLWGSVPAPWTLYRGIRALPAGHFLWVGESGARDPQPFCVISDVIAHAAARPAQGSRSEALEAISAALRSTIAAHLVSDVPVGVFLSGGLDSSLIAALVRERGVVPQSLTLGFAEYANTLDDEAPHAQALARALGTRHDTVAVRQSDFAAQCAQLLAAMDQPSIDGVNTWFVARAAASVGIKVALSGLGGDELLASYPSFHQVPQLVRWMGPPSRVPGLGALVRKLAEPAARLWASPKCAGLLEYGGTTAGAYLLRRGLHMPWELARVMDPEMARAGWEKLQTTERLDRTTRAIGGAAKDRLAVSALEMSWYMRHQLLADADWAGMAHSLEIRVPFVDLDLLRQTAPWFARYPDISKQEVVRAAAPQLPAGLFERPKVGFNIPVRQWLGGSPGSTHGLRGWSRQVHASQRSRSAGPAKRRVLISTLAPHQGGVPAMAGFAADTLAQQGFEPVFAFHATYSTTPELSVPSFRLLQRRPGHRVSFDAQGRELHAFGAWLPELEFTHYLPTREWRRLMDGCDAFVAVSGNVLAATPFHLTRRPYVAWTATDWEGDRRDRVRQFPWPRRLLDTCINGPVIRRLERRLLRGGRVLALSEYTARMLQLRAGTALPRVLLPMPVDLDLFTPAPQARVSGRIGFAGRFNDPRKNIGLLLAAAAQLRQDRPDVHLVLMGDTPQAALRDTVTRLGLQDHVSFHAGLSREAMRDLLRTFDVFVLPSHQEGLCIAALEALACGVPVVSTRCGGPEEFVVPGVSGELVDNRPEAVAAAAARIMDDAAARAALSPAARRLVEERYGRAHARAVLLQQVQEAFPAPPDEAAALGDGRIEPAVSA
jgi:asparagine synthase (glutamine-hydrolysing)